MILHIVCLFTYILSWMNGYCIVSIRLKEWLCILKVIHNMIAGGNRRDGNLLNNECIVLIGNKSIIEYPAVARIVRMLWIALFCVRIFELSCSCSRCRFTVCWKKMNGRADAALSSNAESYSFLSSPLCCIDRTTSKNVTILFTRQNSHDTLYSANAELKISG